MKTSLEILSRYSIKAATPKYGCLMAQLPSLDATLPNWAADHIPSSEFAEDGIETEPHVTVLYGFNLGFDTNQLFRTLSNFGPIRLEVVGLERFECPEYDVLKLGVKSPDLIRLNKILMKEYADEIAAQKYSYNPHITVAYVKKGACPDLTWPEVSGMKLTSLQCLYSLPDKKGRRVFDLACAQIAKASLPRLLAIETLARKLPAIIAAKRPKAIASMLKRHDQVRDAAEKIYKSHLDRLLAGVEAEVLANLRSRATNRGALKARAMKPGQPIIKAASTTPTEANFDLKSFTARFLKAMSDAATESFEVCSSGLITDLDPDEEATDKGIIKKFLFARENKVRGCPQEIFDQVQRSLTQGDAAGETMDELADRVREEFDGISKGRAFVIARTESQSAYGSAQAAVLEKEGYETKRWITSHDELVRESHQEAEDEGAIDMDEDFSNGLAFPGDPDGPANEVIGCRCYLIKGDPTDNGNEEDDE